MKKISVIIPAFNAEKSIESTIRSIETQTYNLIEIIVVDDGSKDGTKSLCKKLAQEYGNIEVVSQENQGPGKARQNGVAHAHGSYISFIDADDYIDPKTYEIIVTTMKEQEADIVQFGYECVDTLGNTLKSRTLKNEICEGAKQCYSDFITQKNCTNFLWNKVYKYTLFHDVKWSDLYYSEDYYLLAQLYGKATKTVTIVDKLYYYVQSESNACNQPFNTKRLDQIEAGKFVCDYTENNFPELKAFALFYIVTNSARLCERAFYSDFRGKDKVIHELKSTFKTYFKEMKKECKKRNIPIPMDRYSRAFSISPTVALIMKKKDHLNG